MQNNNRGFATRTVAAAIKKFALALTMTMGVAACGHKAEQAPEVQTVLPAPTVTRHVGVDRTTPGLAGRSLVALGASSTAIPIDTSLGSVDVPVLSDTGLVVIQDSNGHFIYMGQAKTDTGSNSIDAESTARLLLYSGPQVPLVIATFGYTVLRQNVPEIGTLVDLINSRVADETQNWGDPNDAAFMQARADAVNAIINYANANVPSASRASKASPSRSTVTAKSTSVSDSFELRGYFTTPTKNDQSDLSVYGLVIDGAQYQRAIVNRGDRYVAAYDANGNYLGLLPPGDGDVTPFYPRALASFPDADSISIYGPGQGSSDDSSRITVPLIADVVMKIAIPALNFINSDSCVEALSTPELYGGVKESGPIWAGLYSSLITSNEFQNTSPGGLDEAKAATAGVIDGLKDLALDRLKDAYVPCGKAIVQNLAAQGFLGTFAPEVETAYLSVQFIIAVKDIGTASYAIYKSNAFEPFQLHRYLSGSYSTTMAPEGQTQGPTVTKQYTNNSGQQVTADMDCTPDVPPSGGKVVDVTFSIDVVTGSLNIRPTNGTDQGFTSMSYDIAHDTFSAAETSTDTQPSDDGVFTYTHQSNDALTGTYDRHNDTFFVHNSTQTVVSWSLDRQTVVCTGVGNWGTEPGTVFQHQ